MAAIGGMKEHNNTPFASLDVYSSKSMRESGRVGLDLSPEADFEFGSQVSLPQRLNMERIVGRISFITLYSRTQLSSRDTCDKVWGGGMGSCKVEVIQRHSLLS